MTGWLVASAVCAMTAGCLLGSWNVAKRAELQRQRRLRERLVGLVPYGVQGGASGWAVVQRVRNRKRIQQRKAQVERHMPEMIDALSLAMGAGLSFESAFRMYSTRFSDELACACREACRSWESGLVTREDALRALAAELDVPIMGRFVSNVLRCLKYGSPMRRTLEALAQEARSAYKARMEEQVAKAPAKMLMPTTALILPAMLIMVMAPIVLDFA